MTVLQENTLVTLPGDATFTAPQGWSIARDAGAVELLAPEGDLRIHLVATESEGEFEALANRVRAQLGYPPLAIKAAGDEPPRDGWRQIRTIVHAVAAADPNWSQTSIYRGDAVTLAVVQQGSMATFEKRMAASLLVTQSVRGHGFAPEDLTGRSPRPFGRHEIDEVRGFLAEAMALLGVPGIGLGLASADEIMFAGGLGEREVHAGLPATAASLFQIASNTKSLTTLLLARLVDQGRIAWSDRVRNVFPEFRLGDPEVTDRIEIRHLVSASTGLPRRDLVWGLTFDHATPPEATFALLAQSRPTTGFGEVYQYSNLMAAAAGFVAGRVAFPDLPLGAAYDRAMQDLVFDPLGMTATTFDGALARSRDHAASHGSTIDGAPVARSVSDGAIHALRPSGGAWSNVDDFLAYARLELRGGLLPGGQAVVSSVNLLERRKPFVPIGETGAYGMGLSLDRSGGVLALGHGGSLPGYMSDFSVFPEAGLAAVVLTNADNGQFLLQAFRRRLLELLYDAQPKAEAQVRGWAERLAAERETIRNTVLMPPTPQTRARLAQSYRSAELGDFTIAKSDEAVDATFASMTVALGERRDPDGGVSLVTMDPILRGMAFALVEREGRSALVAREGQYEYVYEEQAQ